VEAVQSLVAPAQCLESPVQVPRWWHPLRQRHLQLPTSNRTHRPPAADVMVVQEASEVTIQVWGVAEGQEVIEAP